MIKVFYRKEFFKGYTGLCESLFCMPFEDPKFFIEDKFENDRFLPLIEQGKDYIEFSSIENCDYVVIPYKWESKNQQNLFLINEATKNNKKIIALHNDDVHPQSKIDINEGYLFSTNIEKSKKQHNEFSFPAFTGDFFEQYGSKYIESREDQMTIGFCGAITNYIRTVVLNKIETISTFKKDLIIRKSFWATNEMSKDEARIGYFNNMVNNCFILCMRGAGNFSYRLYETLMMGRIPIIINSDQCFPFENIINYNDTSIIIDSSNINDIESIISNWISNKSENDILNIQKRNREIWIEYLSPLGWIKNFEREINGINQWSLKSTFINHGYDKIEYSSIHDNFIKWVIDFNKNLSILDIGGGNGRICLRLPDNINYLGIDVNEEAINLTNVYFRDKPNISFKLDDVDFSKFDYFDFKDIVYIDSVLTMVKDPFILLKKLFKKCNYIFLNRNPLFNEKSKSLNYKWGGMKEDSILWEIGYNDINELCELNNFQLIKIDNSCFVLKNNLINE